MSRETVCFSWYSDMSKRCRRNAQALAELPGELGLADARRAHEDEVGDGLVGRAEARARALDGLDHGLDRRVLAEDVAT